ncbi:Transcription factor, fungi [Penicillium expansum]|nr:Transcription factor, fungi [Penicillium expansum]
MSSKSITPVREHRRKRVRKGTRSCWEYKGTSCLSQEFLEDQPPRDAESSALSQRMERVENLLEKFMRSVSQGTGDNRPVDNPVDVFTPLSTSATNNLSRPSVVSTFNKAIIQQPETNTSISSPQSAPVSDFSGLVSATNGSPIGGIDRLQQRLVAMLPCQEDVDLLSGTSHGWWLIRRHMMPHLLKPPENDPENPFDVLAVSKSHPMVIARLLLCVAICIQQLPSKADLGRLRTTMPLQEMMENNIAFITTRVTSDDEMTGSMEGVECLALQGIYQANAGSLRRSWITFRRAINVAQLMGLHRVPSKTSQAVPDWKETKRHYIWYQIMQAERYLSLTLGVEDSSGSLRLEIPHFGTISITRSGTVQSLEGDRILGANPHPRATLTGVRPPFETRGFDSAHPQTTTGPTSTLVSAPGSQGHRNANMGGETMDDNAMGMNDTVLQFTSSHFPVFENSTFNDITEWSLQESDTIFFDGLLNTDVEGNWNF